MSATASLLASLDTISAETAVMLETLNAHAMVLPAGDAREAKRRVFEIRARTQELFEWLSEVRLEEPRN